MKYEGDGQREGRYGEKAHRQDGQRKVEDIVVPEVVQNGRDAGQNGEDEQNRADDREEEQGAVVHQDGEDGFDDLHPVRYGRELGYGAFRAVHVISGDFHDGIAVVQGVDADFRFQFKARGENGEVFDEPLGKDAVARQDVMQVALEQFVDEHADGLVSRIMHGALVFPAVNAGVMAVSAYHVRISLENRFQQAGEVGGGIGQVCIHHYVNVRIYFPERLFNGHGLTLPFFLKQRAGTA